VGLRRGFKSEANTYAREIRTELGLASDAPLCPFMTANHLAVPVEKLSTFSAILPDQTAYLSRTGSNIRFSAMTACLGRERVIIYNDYLHVTRVHADIMHEISHLILLHPPHRLRADTGGRHFDNDLEEEANWLGPALLVSEESALAIAQRGMSINQAAKIYKVSPGLMQMRLNVTGAMKRVARAA
jgi:Zn-dependent peptidase ImmA (M78 family)